MLHTLQGQARVGAASSSACRSHSTELRLSWSRLWELDGALKPGPVDHGPSSEASLLRVRAGCSCAPGYEQAPYLLLVQDAAKVVQKVINASSSLSFNLIALTAVS